MFVCPAAAGSVIFGHGSGALPAAHPAPGSAAPAALLFAPAVGAQVIPAAPLQQHLDLATPLFIHRHLPGEVGALVAAGGPEGRRGAGAGREALQRAVLGGQVGRGGAFAVQLGALLLQGGPGGQHLDVIARVLPLRPLAFQPFRAVVEREKGQREERGLFLTSWGFFCGVEEGEEVWVMGSTGVGLGQHWDSSVTAVTPALS